MSIKNFTVKSVGAAFVLIVAGAFAGLSYGADPDSQTCPTAASIQSFPDIDSPPATIYYFIPEGADAVWWKDSKDDKGLPTKLTSVSIFDHNNSNAINNVVCSYRTSKNLAISLYIFYNKERNTKTYRATPAHLDQIPADWMMINATDTTPEGLLCMTDDPMKCPFLLSEHKLDNVE